MEEYSVKTARGLKNNPDAKIIRENVFVSEQGFENEFDEIDKNAVHTVIYSGGYPVATGRLYVYENSAHIGRIAVLKAYRGRKLGQKIVSVLEEFARQEGFSECCLSAQTRAEEFYGKLGYTSYGEIFYDEYCPHIMMKKGLSE